MDCYHDDEQKKKLLLREHSLDSGQSDDDSVSQLVVKEKKRRFSIWWFFVLQLILLLLFAAVALGLVVAIGSGADHKFKSYTPAEPAVLFTEQRLDGRLFDDNPFKGPPSEAMEDSWNALLKNTYVRISQDELSHLNRTSTPVQDGSGDFLGSLDMYHQLHCVRYIHQFVHPEYYTVPETNIDVMDHVDHCIDMIRQVVMCHADPAIMTFSYHPDHPIAWPEFDLNHECRSWESLDAWSSQPDRALDNSIMHILSKNPNYVGGVFDGHEDK